jgi:hypothetical protein
VGAIAPPESLAPHQRLRHTVFCKAKNRMAYNTGCQAADQNYAAQLPKTIMCVEPGGRNFAWAKLRGLPPGAQRSG